MSQSWVDPFAGGTSVPSVSWKGAPIGATVQMQVTEPAELVQSRNFETGQPESWPDGNPKMSAVVKGMVNGELRSIWAQKPSSMFRAIADAQQAAGQSIGPGGVLTVRLVGEKPNENPRLHPQKLFEAHYQPPNAFAEQPVQQPVQPVQAVQAPPQQGGWQPAPGEAAPAWGAPQAPVQQPVQQPAWNPTAQAQPVQSQLPTDPAALAAQLGALSNEPPF